MKLGIKVGPQKQSFDDLVQTNPDCAEVWFNISRKDNYGDLFYALKKRTIDVGLHYWGVLPDGTWTNIAYPDSEIIKQSLGLMRQTIDIAAQNGFAYVNIHPGTQTKVALDLDKEEFTQLSDPVDFAVSQKLFLTNATALNDYARSRGILFSVESVPSRVTDGWYDPNSRIRPKNIYELPVDVIKYAAERGLFVANDFCHTAANKITNDVHEIWTFLYRMTKELAPMTRLIHLGFTVPPYNGTDFHDHLDNPLLETSHAIPNTIQMVELLKLFGGRDDVWVITEPKEDHVKNYFLAQKILELASTKPLQI